MNSSTCLPFFSVARFKQDKVMWNINLSHREVIVTFVRLSYPSSVKALTLI